MLYSVMHLPSISEISKTYYPLLAEKEIKSLSDVPKDFCLYDKNNVSVCWSPFDYINSNAEIVVVGITPGWQQASIAYEVAANAHEQGLDYLDAAKKVKAQASFAGSMRKNLITMLDGLNVNNYLDIESCAELFGRYSSKLHTTSSLRYPVFVKGKNYTGHSPDILKHPGLLAITENLLSKELLKISPKIIVPLGKAANACVEHVMPDCKTSLVLGGFPHPSGANGHRISQFQLLKKSLKKGVLG